MNDYGVFIFKVIVLSALLSLVIKYAGPLIPIDQPYTESLNGLVTTIVVLPSVVVGVGLLVALKKSSQQSL